MPDATAKSEQLSVDQLAQFAAAWQARRVGAEAGDAPGGSDDDDAAALAPAIQFRRIRLTQRNRDVLNAAN
jgi:hypothetical protein